MIILDDINKCTGCEACSNICPVSCISMEGSAEGFLYPQIDNALCIKCGLCRKTCPINSISINDKRDFEAYAFMCLDDNIRKHSSSGGVFRLLSEQIINSGGAVFGAFLDDEFTVRHSIADDLTGLHKLQKSKYVQSYIGNSYKKVKEFLIKDKDVLFSGTPCQIAGLKNFLGRDYGKLICIDVVCFGVPSPMIFHKYINALEIKNKSKIKVFDFRNKKNGWTGKNFGIEIEFESGSVINEYVTKNLYHKAFFNGCNVRKSCFDCKYKNGYRKSDLTLADYWGVEKYSPEMDDGNGTTLVLTNNEKGNAILEKIEKFSNYKKVNKETAFLDNAAAIQSKRMNKHRTKFFEDIRKDKDGKEFLNILYKYTHISFLKRVMMSIRRRIIKMLDIRKVEV